MAQKKIEVIISGSGSELEQALDKARGSINDFGTAGDKAGTKLTQMIKKASSSFSAIGSKARSAGSSIAGAFSKAGNSVKDFSSKVKEAQNALDDLDFSEIAGGGIIVGGVTAAFVGLLDKINQASRAMSRLQGMTGTSGIDAEAMNESLANVYATGAGEGWEDVAQAMGTVHQQLGDVGQSLEDATQGALLMRDAFNIDVNESVRAATMLMKEFGVSSEEAYTLIAQGAQNGANKNGDLADTLNEYAVQFSQLGFDAEQFTGVLIAGAQSGAWSIDKVGDAIKEFNIRVKDGSKTTAEGFAAIGMDADVMAQRFAAGGQSAQTAFQEVITALKEMEDPVAQNIAGVNLFGTMWEDLGAQGIFALDGINSKADTTADTLAQLQVSQLSSFGEVFEYISRQIETGLIMPLMQEAMPLLREFALFLTQFFASVRENGLGETLKNMIPPEVQVALGALAGIIGGVLVASIIALGTAASALAAPFLAAASAALPMIGIGAAVGAAVVIAIQAFDGLRNSFSILNTLSDTVSFVMNSIMAAFSGSFDAIMESGSAFIDAFCALFDAIAPVLAVVVAAFSTSFDIAGGILGTFVAVAGDLISGAIDILTGIITFLTGVFTGDWQMAWDGVCQIFEGAFNTMFNIASGIIDGITGMVNSIISKINSVSGMSLPAIGGSEPGTRLARGGIYGKGAFLTTFAEESPEAAIPIDGSQRAKDLWTKTGQMLGMFREDNAGGISVAPSFSGTSYSGPSSSAFGGPMQADIVVKMDKNIEGIDEVRSKIADLRSQGKAVGDNLYDSLEDKMKQMMEDLAQGFSDVQENAQELSREFIDFKIESNFSHLKGAARLEASLWLDTRDALDAVDEYRDKFVESTQEAQALVEAARKSGDAESLKNAQALLEQRKAEEVAAESWIAQEKLNILKDYNEQYLQEYRNCKDIQAEIDEAKNNLDLQRLQEILSEENAIRMNDMAAQQEMMTLYQESYLAANVTTAQLTSDMYSTIYDSLNDNINKLIMGTITWGDAIRNLGASLIQTIVNFYAQKLAGMITASLMGESMEKAQAAKSTALAAQQGAAWASAALFKEMVLPGTAGIALGSIAASSAGLSAIDSVPMLASGGITKGPTLAMVGEGRYQEAVIPLNKSYFEKAGLTNSGPGQNYNITIQAIDAKSVDRLFKRHGSSIVKSMQNQSFKRTGRGQSI